LPSDLLISSQYFHWYLFLFSNHY